MNWASFTVVKAVSSLIFIIAYMILSIYRWYFRVSIRSLSLKGRVRASYLLIGDLTGLYKSSFIQSSNIILLIYIS
jgi:hypothetical protein